MKRLIGIFMVLLMTLTFSAFTWEGELDPNNFNNWEVVDAMPSPQAFIWLIIKNPDQASPINTVAIGVGRYKSLLFYRYFKYGEPYYYVFNVENSRYMRSNLTDEEKLSCMRCHRKELGNPI